MAAYTTILCDDAGPVARLTLNRPDKRNPLGPATCGELVHALAALAAAPAVRVVVLTGAGPAFSAGGDLAAMSGQAGPDAIAPASLPALFTAMHGLGKPIIAMVGGPALAGGLGLMVACDLVVASSTAVFGLTEIAVGLWPMMITAEITRSVGRKRTLEMMLTGRKLVADEALAAGLVNRVVGPDQLEAETMALATSIAQRSPAAMALGLRAFYASQDLPYPEQLSYLEGQLGRVLALEDAAEGIAAFLGKRDPVWKGALRRMRRGTDIAAACAVLRAGGLVAFPTETVYGLGAAARDPAAVARIFAAKGRPANHPLIVHLADAAEAPAWAAAWSADARVLAAAFWPGPLTLIVPVADDVPRAVTGGAPTIGLRVPAHPTAHALLAAFAGGVAAPSANRFGGTSPTQADHVVADLGDAVDYVLDGAPCDVGVESTIVDLSGPAPALLRPGAVTRDELAAALGQAPTGASTTPAPGTLASHYAPRARVITCALAEVAPALAALVAPGPVAVLARAADLATLALGADVVAAPLDDDPRAAARALYGTLRALDERGVATIIAVPPPAVGLGEAIADRLRRAGGPRPARG